MQAQLGLWGQLGVQASKVRKDLRVLKVCKVHQGPKVVREKKGTVERRDPRVQVGLRGNWYKSLHFLIIFKKF